MKLSFLVLFLFSLNCFGQEVTEETVEIRKKHFQIDWKYKAGEYFIFDCERSHFACVNIDGDVNCREERKFAIEKKSKSYPCAPLKKFKDKKSCVEKSYEFVDNNPLKRFCYPK